MRQSLSEKRRVHRVSFDTPRPAAVAGLQVHLLDLSTTGARIEHEAPLNVRRELKLRFDQGENSFVLSCVVVRCRLQRSLARPGTVAYSSGLRFSSADEPSREKVRGLVASLLGERSDETGVPSRVVTAV